MREAAKTVIRPGGGVKATDRTVSASLARSGRVRDSRSLDREPARSAREQSDPALVLCGTIVGGQVNLAT